MEEQILQQKSKVEWLKLGDGNNSFFHATVKEKNKRIGIYQLEDSTGRLLTDLQEIENEVLSFYDGLICHTAPNLEGVNIVALRSGSQLDTTAQLSLIGPVFELEVVTVLKGIGDSKALGIDGFNANFFKYTWQVIGKDAMAAIHEFFYSRYLISGCQLCVSHSYPQNCRC